MSKIYGRKGNIETRGRTIDLHIFAIIKKYMCMCCNNKGVVVISHRYGDNTHSCVGFDQYLTPN